MSTKRRDRIMSEGWPFFLPKFPPGPPPATLTKQKIRGEAFLITVGAFLLTVELLCLQSLIGCTPRGSCNNTLLRRVLRRFSNTSGS